MYLKFITNKGCGEVVSTPSSLIKRSRVRFPLGTESPLLGSAEVSGLIPLGYGVAFVRERFTP
ncbi:hypothetical protein H5410_026020 [Solanum commersonii]|uniref:Uncharacterized protein n=1 Tax=Solanum commersonii TaxID=4109 RepID=A0A9J5YXI9_SOLCO|nr:hypothetical protein H5410_026020 [Solanum commersonii]